MRRFPLLHLPRWHVFPSGTLRTQSLLFEHCTTTSADEELAPDLVLELLLELDELPFDDPSPDAELAEGAAELLLVEAVGLEAAEATGMLRVVGRAVPCRLSNAQWPV